MLDSEASMTTFLNLIATEPDIARVPVMVDSSKWRVIEAGLKCVQGKARRQLDQPEGGRRGVPRARRASSGATAPAVVVMAFDEKGQADTVERKVEICQRAYKLLTEKVGFDPHDIIFDPEHPGRSPPASRSTTTTPSTSSRRRATSKRPARARRFGRRHQHLVLVPRQQRRARGDARGVPLPRHQGRHGHGHRQRRPARRVRRDPAGAAGATSRTCSSTAGRTRPSAWSSSPRRSRAGGKKQGGRWPGATRTVEERLSHALVKGIVDYIEADIEEARAEVSTAPLDSHRRPADGRHEHRRRPVRRRQDVPAAGGEERARDEEGRRLPAAVHGGGEERPARHARAQGKVRAWPR